MKVLLNLLLKFTTNEILTEHSDISQGNKTRITYSQQHSLLYKITWNKQSLLPNACTWSRQHIY